LSAACDTTGVFDDFAFADAAAALKSAAAACTDWRRGPVVLLLDDALNHMPWECMSMFQSASVTRMPALSFIFSALQRPVAELPSPLPLVSVLNPGNDLPRTAAAMAPILKDISSVLDVTLTQFTNSCPPSTELASRVHRSVGYLYFGHGAGEPFLSREDLLCFGSSQLQWSLLMGCSSVSVRKRGVFDADGPVHAYLMAGARCVVGNLWDVTDKDIDAYTIAVLREWLLANDGIAHKTAATLTLELLQVMHSRRSVCKLKYAVGAAPVMYGLPC
jgi:separase